MSTAKRVASKLKKGYDDPEWWRAQVRSRIAKPLLNSRDTGENYFDKDWDNLFILDAARADLFEEATDVSKFDDYYRTLSPGSSSEEWMRECFANNTWDDVVYVSGNPWVSRIGSDSFHKVYNLWVDEFGLDKSATASEGTLAEHDPKGLGTIEARHLSDVAREVHKQHPKKRLVVHYFQPHAPCIGNKDGSVKEEVRVEVDLEKALRKGRTSFEEVWEAYKENLLYALTHARGLAEDIGGKTTYTADHGELMGEWLWPVPMRGYAHPSGLHHKKLLEVPWAIENNGKRRKIVSDEVTERDEHTEEINSHLKALGYK